jgi:tetratricopeptide (TPR) repeat protein
MFAIVTIAAGNPFTLAGDKFDEFLGGEPDLTEESSRFTLNAGSNRSEVWKVALAVAGDDPIFGEGGGGFQFRYNQERDDPNQLARDAHSVELEMLSELGIVGLTLFVLAMTGAFAGAWRARRLGPSAAQLSCGALAAGAYWLTHASLDWFWPFPAVTGPALALLGAAAAPALLMPERVDAPSGRRAVLVALVVFVLLLIPPFLSERLVDRSVDTFRADTQQAYDDLALARDLNPLSDQPALTEGSIALALKDNERAIESFREAIRKRPEEYVGHFFLALIYAKSDPAQARTELAVVAELNPLEQRIDEIRKRIDKAERQAR